MNTAEDCWDKFRDWFLDGRRSEDVDDDEYICLRDKGLREWGAVWERDASSDDPNYYLTFEDARKASAFLMRWT